MEKSTGDGSVDGGPDLSKLQSRAGWFGSAVAWGFLKSRRMKRLHRLRICESQRTALSAEDHGNHAGVIRQLTSLAQEVGESHALAPPFEAK